MSALTNPSFFYRVNGDPRLISARSEMEARRTYQALVPSADTPTTVRFATPKEIDAYMAPLKASLEESAAKPTRHVMVIRHELSHTQWLYLKDRAEELGCTMRDYLASHGTEGTYQ